jgi:hypothetical protein
MSATDYPALENGIPAELASYLDDLVEVLSGVTTLAAVYVVGSAAVGAYMQGSSDVDVIAVTDRSLALSERKALVRAAEAIHCPARRLELVVYPRGSDVWEVNLNTGEPATYDTADEPGFWFVIDRAIAETHAIPLVGPPWAELFEPVPRNELLAALDESLDRVGALNAARTWAWLEDGTWISKPAAERWLAARVGETLEAAR